MPTFITIFIFYFSAAKETSYYSALTAVCVRSQKKENIILLSLTFVRADRIERRKGSKQAGREARQDHTITIDMIDALKYRSVFHLPCDRCHQNACHQKVHLTKNVSAKSLHLLRHVSKRNWIILEYSIIKNLFVQ